MAPSGGKIQNWSDTYLKNFELMLHLLVEFWTKFTTVVELKKTVLTLIGMSYEIKNNVHL